MKIIHTGDLHLGSAMRNLPQDKARLRKAEMLDAFRRLCLYARDNSVCAVLIAGDLFDENKVSAATRAEVLSAIESAQPTYFFYVSGNHDDEFSFEEKKPPNLYLFSRNHSWQSYELPDNVTITGIDTRNLRPACYAGLALPTDKFNIVLMHGDVNHLQGAESIPLNLLQNKNIDYLALGHIHLPMMRAERLDGRGTYRYCGCLEGRGFDESGKHGAFLLEIRDGKCLSEQFLVFAKREVCVRTVDISACENYYDVERCALTAIRDVRKEDVVKLVLKGAPKAGLHKDIPTLTARLAENVFHLRVADESKVYIDYQRYQNDLSERGEFIREVGRYAMSEEERAEVLDVGLKGLAGEDIDL